MPGQQEELASALAEAKKPKKAMPDDIKRKMAEVDALAKADFDKGIFITPETYGNLLKAKKEAENALKSGTEYKFPLVLKDLEFFLAAARREHEFERRPSAVVECVDRFLSQLATDERMPAGARRRITPSLKKQVLRDVRFELACDRRRYSNQSGMLSQESQLKIYEKLEERFGISIPNDRKAGTDRLLHSVLIKG